MTQTKINLVDQAIGSVPYASVTSSAIDQTQSTIFVPPLIASGGVETLSQGFTIVGALNTPRENNTVTLLQNGMVLVVGGDNGGGTILSSAELYNPSTQVWTNTGSMVTARKYHRAVLLPNGNVLVAGGSTPGNTAVATCEIYNPNTGLWTSTGSLPGVHSQFYMALLNTGFVLAAGGINNSHSAINTAALYNPNTGTWAATGTMTGARFHFPSTDSERMVVLSNGKALIAGGTANGSIGLSTTTIYDPIAATWSSAGSLSVGRFSHNLVALRNGMALVIGGTTNESIALATTELYDPVGNSWSLSGSLNQYRGDCFSQLLPNGNILTGAGVGFDGGFYSSTEVYNVGTATWAFSTDMTVQDEGNSSSIMASGQIMIAGGLGLATPQVYGLFTSLVSPAGTDKAIQFNAAGVFGGDATNFTWDDGETVLRIGGSTVRYNSGPGLQDRLDIAGGSIFLTTNIPPGGVNPNISLDPQNGLHLFQLDPVTNIGPLTVALGIDGTCSFFGSGNIINFSPANNGQIYMGSNFGVNGNIPDPSVIMQLDSTSQAFLPPVMTTTQKNAMVVHANGTITVVNAAALDGSGTGIHLGNADLDEGSQWSAASDDNNTTAASIASAINTATSTTHCTATATGAVVNITANNPGTDGDVNFSTDDPGNLPWSNQSWDLLQFGSPAIGSIIFDVTLGKVCVFSNATHTWQTITSA